MAGLHSNFGGRRLVDTVSAETRSAVMSRVRGKDTKPELVVRRLLHTLGYRFRLHRRDLPGTPDIVFPRRRKVVFVHGCFWHHHACHLGRVPKSRQDFWIAKFEENQERDAQNLALLHTAGWRTLIIWECEIAEPNCLVVRIREFLDA